MKTPPFIVAAILAVFLPSARATSVTFGGVPTARTVVDAASNQLTSGSLVMAGVFTSTAFSINPSLSLQANFDTVGSAGGWKQFTLDPSTGFPNPATTNNLTVNLNGKVSGQVLDNNTPQADFFNGKALYLWVFNAASVGAATQMGIFTATSASTVWVFPTNALGVGDTTTLSTRADLTPTITAIGGFGAATSSQFILTNNFNVSPVPEPGVAAFGVLAGISGIFTRRRRLR